MLFQVQRLESKNMRQD